MTEHEDIPRQYSMSGTATYIPVQDTWGHMHAHSQAHSVQESKPPDLLSLLHALSVGPLAS